MKHRILGTIAALCFLGLLLAGCASDDGTLAPDSTVKLVLPLVAGFAVSVYAANKNRSTGANSEAARQGDVKNEAYSNNNPLASRVDG